MTEIRETIIFITNYLSLKTLFEIHLNLTNQFLSLQQKILIKLLCCFQGTFCDEECFNASACSNSGSCLFNSTLDEFYCDCDSAFGGSLCTDELSVPDDDDNSLSTAGAALLAIFIIIVVILLILAVILTVKYFNNTKISSGSFSPKKEENAENNRAKPSDFPEFHIPRAKLERLIWRMFKQRYRKSLSRCLSFLRKLEKYAFIYVVS